MNIIRHGCKSIVFFTLLGGTLVTAQAAVFRVTDSMNDMRQGHTSTLLTNGTVLIAGGGNATAEIYDPIGESFFPVGNMTIVRSGHTATLLQNGNVLIVGGTSSADAEVYDPVRQEFSPAGAMTTPRNGSTATLLQDGTVLIAGGFAGGALATAEIYNPVGGSFTLIAGTMVGGRSAHEATLLGDGTVLITGGPHPFSSGGGGRSEAETYDPITRTFTNTATLMTSSRNFHNATLLTNGHVLLTGGVLGQGIAFISTETYDPVTRAFTAAANLNVARVGESATLLPDGTVLVAGGAGAAATAAEIYDPVADTFTLTASLNEGRSGHRAALLRDGRVLITSGHSAELYETGAGAPPVTKTIGNWTGPERSVTTNDLHAVTFGNGVFAAVGKAGTVVRSETGVDWSSQASNVTNELRAVAFGDGLFVAVGFAGAILTSSDAILWQEQSSEIVTNLNGIVFGHGRFVAVGDGGTVLTSSNGTIWTAHDSRTTSDLLSVTFGKGVFATTSPRSGNFLNSPDGESWSVGTFIQPVAYYGIACGAQTFLAVGDSSLHNPFFILAQSSNGLNYDFLSMADDSRGQYELLAATYGAGSFVAVGRLGTIIASHDETNFYYCEPGTAVTLRGVCFGNNTFVAVGDGGAILQSDPVMRLTLRLTELVELSVSGTTGQTYRVESTDSLGAAAVWQTLTNLFMASNPTLWLDKRPFQPGRFYRAYAPVNLIVNGGFESPGFTAAPAYRYLAADGVSSPVLTELPGWTVTNDDVGEPPFLVKRTGYPGEVRAGDYALILNQGSGIAATFPAVAGRNYVLSLWLRPADGVDNIPPAPLVVRAAGVETTLPLISGWTYRTFLFTATSTTPAASLQLFNASPAGDYRSWNLDEVKVEPMP